MRPKTQLKNRPSSLTIEYCPGIVVA